MRSISARLSVARNAVSSSLVAPCLDKTSVKLIPQLDEAAAWILCVMVGVLRLKRLRLKRLCLKRLRLCVKRLLDAPHLLEHACDGGELPRRPGREGARPAQALALEVGDDVVGEALGARDGLGRVGRLRRVRRGVRARRFAAAAAVAGRSRRRRRRRQPPQGALERLVGRAPQRPALLLAQGVELVHAIRADLAIGRTGSFVST